MRYFARWLFALGAILCILSTGAKPYWQSRLQVSVGGAPPAFQGMADVVASPVACWSLRACSAALRGTRAVNVCNVADVVCADLSTDAVTGNLVVTTIGGSNCSVVVCTVQIIYDQTTGNACSAANCDMSNSSIGSRPTFIVSCTNSLPCMDFAGAQALSTSNNYTRSQPFTVSIVAERTGSTSSFADAFFAPTDGVQFGFGNAPNSSLLFCGTVTTATAADNAFHSLNSVANGLSSDNNVDGVQNTVNCGANGINGSTMLIGGTANNLTGRIAELALWASAFSTTNSSNMYANQHVYWGY